ncbi:MAG: AAA family ATPase, partial [Candidatus Omnitrophota bacterium]
MLSQLTIQNFGLIDKLSIDFCAGLNVFTGETGAGKSILIDALRYALGEKMNSRFVRDTEKPLVVEAVFEVSDRLFSAGEISFPLSEYMSDEDPSLIINRTYLPDGRTRTKINGFTVTAAQLKETGDHLVDFHGPHDHQMLLSESSHIGILDRLSNIENLKKSYLNCYKAYSGLNKKLDDLRALSRTRERDMDLLKHQVKELSQVPLENDKYEEVLNETNRINNAEKLSEYARKIADLLDNEENGINALLTLAFSALQRLNN